MFSKVLLTPVKMSCRLFVHSIHREWLKHYYSSVATSPLYYTPVSGNHHFTPLNTLQHVSVIVLLHLGFTYSWIFNFIDEFCVYTTVVSYFLFHFITFAYVSSLFYFSLAMLCRMKMRRKNIFALCFIL